MKHLIVGALVGGLFVATPAEAQTVRVDASVRIGPNVRIGVHSRPYYYRAQVHRPNVYRTYRHYRPWYRRPYARAVVVVPRPHVHPPGLHPAHPHGHGRVHPRVERRHDRYDRHHRRDRDRARRHR